MAKFSLRKSLPCEQSGVALVWPAGTTPATALEPAHWLEALEKQHRSRVLFM